MKLLTFLVAGCATVNCHSIFQKVSVNGADKGQLTGLRVPPDDYPVYDVSSQDIICQKPGQTSSTIIDVPAGAKVGTWWGHVFGGAQYANDADNPIAASHKGPISVYLAKVDNAASTSKTGLKWFKVSHEGFSGGKWAVDTMIQGGGWWYFTMPSCLASGNYLMRVELIALHNAYSANGAQFYGSCVQINIVGGGSYNGGSTVSFPGAYRQNDPGVQLSIYGTSGNPDMGGKTYPIPGPAPMSCNGQTSGSGNGGGSGSGSPTTTSRASTATQPSSGGGGGSVAIWGQCGGSNYSGPTGCASGTCKKVNDYSQCQP